MFKRMREKRREAGNAEMYNNNNNNNEKKDAVFSSTQLSISDCKSDREVRVFRLFGLILSKIIRKPSRVNRRPLCV